MPDVPLPVIRLWDNKFLLICSELYFSEQIYIDFYYNFPVMYRMSVNPDSRSVNIIGEKHCITSFYGMNQCLIFHLIIKIQVFLISATKRIAF